MEGRLSRQGKGVSALFDALVFFVISLVASGALMTAVSSVSSTAAESDSTRDLGRYASEVQASALACTVGPLNCSINGSEANLGRMAVLECIVTMLDLRISGSSCDLSNPMAAVRCIYSQLIDDRFHFAVLAELEGHGGPLFFSDYASGTSGIGKVRWTCAVPLIVGDAEGTLTLFLWR
jgi:hypothetical protein